MKTIRLQSTVILFVLMGILSSCASIVSKTTYPLMINSNPSGAAVTITNKKGKEIYKGTSPAVVPLKSGAGYFSRAEYQVKFNMKGYEERIVPVNFKLNGWYFGNLFIGGVLGMLIVDPITGAMWRLETQYIAETLQTTSASTESPTLNLVDINSIPADWKEHLVKVN